MRPAFVPGALLIMIVCTSPAPAQSADARTPTAQEQAPARPAAQTPGVRPGGVSVGERREAGVRRVAS